MKEKIRLLQIEQIRFHLPGESDEVKLGARFTNKLTQNEYGIQRFITENGEVSILNLISDGFPDGYSDIRRTLELVLKSRKADKNHKGNWVGINDAVRYFADLSSQGNIWYWEYMRILDPVLTNQLNVIKQEIITPKNEVLTFNNWLSLPDLIKIEFMNEFLNNPVSGKDIINTYVYSKF